VNLFRIKFNCMTKLKLYLKINYWLIIICFFLPFMVDTCISNQLNPQKKHRKQDTAKVQYALVKEQNIKTVMLTDTIIPQPTTLRKLYNFIISPSNDTISGIGFVIYYTRADLYFSIPVVCLLMTLISLVMVYRKKSRHLLLSILSALCIILLFIMIIVNHFKLSEFLIGFWLIFLLYLSATALNWISYKKFRKDKIFSNQFTSEITD
jgi:hypothetical protein